MKNPYGVIAGVMLLAFSLAGPVAADQRVVLGNAAVFQDCDTCPQMVVVPPGEFTMGHDGGEPERYEGPVRDISVANAFAAGRYAVTIAEYHAFLQASGYASSGCWMWDGRNARFDDHASWLNPGYGRPPRDDEPVACLNWLDAHAYVTWLAAHTGQPYRLLTETEWEYLAWGGERKGRFVWGDSPEEACRHANVFDLSAAAAAPESPIDPAPCDDGYAGIAPVGQFKPNAFGVYDIIGNVWEWLQDCYVMPYADNAPADGSAHILASEQCDRRSVRGGSWNTAVERQRPTFRGRDPEDLSSQVFGLRVARDLDGD